MEGFNRRHVSDAEQRLIDRSGCGKRECVSRNVFCGGEWQQRAGAAEKMFCGGVTRAFNSEDGVVIVVVDEEPKYKGTD